MANATCGLKESRSSSCRSVERDRNILTGTNNIGFDKSEVRAQRPRIQGYPDLHCDKPRKQNNLGIIVTLH
jgi:hypothetical protein